MGGGNIPIEAYSRRISDGGTVELFVQDVLADQPMASTVEFVSTTTQALRKVAVSPGGIPARFCPRSRTSMFNQTPAVGANARELCCSLSRTIRPPFRMSSIAQQVEH